MCLPVQVVGEARFGALNSNRPQANLKQLDEFVARCRVLAADAITAMVYADIRFALKNAGTPIPENDIWIAAICVQHEMTLATADKHFLSVKGISLIFRG